VERQVCEGVVIHSDPSDLVLNSKLDHHLPAVARVAFRNAAADRGERGRRGGRGGRRRGGRGGGRRAGIGGTRTQDCKQDPAETFLDASQCFG
jgi:hypothetical protein